MNIEDKIELVKSLLYPSLNHSGYDRFGKDEKRKAEQQQQRKIQQEEEEKTELQTKQISKLTNVKLIKYSHYYPSSNHSGYGFDR